MKKSLKIAGVLSTFLITTMHIIYGNDFGTVDSVDSLWSVQQSRLVKLDGRILPLCDVKTPTCEIEKFLVHPTNHPANVVTPDSLICEVWGRSKSLRKDTLLTSDLFWVLRPYFDWWRHIDPHFRIDQPVYLADDYKIRRAYKQLTAPGFLMLNINDTLIVEQSVDPFFQKGDLIKEINGVPVSEYLKYSYDDRYISPIFLLRNYYFNLFFEYKFSLVRNGEEIDGSVDSKPYLNTDYLISKQREFHTQIFSNAKAGYMAIDQFFPVNTVLIKKLYNAILTAKKQGCNSFIIDLRRNPGGYGHAFDKLLSIFIDKPVIPYMKSQKLKVTKENLHDYGFVTDSLIGQLIEMPEKEIITSISLNRKMYIPGMTYYILMSKDTGSVAATFCNIMQYNDAAFLVGEPLLHNALKYGETIDGKTILPTLLAVSNISTIEYDEHTKAVDGVLKPDLYIPYIAADYLSGKDAMLEKLLVIIQNKMN